MDYLCFFNLILSLSVLSTVAAKSIMKKTDLEHLVMDLQKQVRQLQTVRQQDRATIERLKEKIMSGATATPSSSTEDQIEAKWMTVSKIEETTTLPPKVQPGGKTVGLNGDDGMDLDELRTRLLSTEDADDVTDSETATLLRREMDALRQRLNDHDGHHGAATRDATIRWLRGAVENLRREMREVASSVNVSAALAQRQRLQSLSSLFESDVASLRRGAEAAQADRQREAAAVAQLRRDVEELRGRATDAAQHSQKLTAEVEALKGEMRDRVEDSSMHLEQRSHEIQNKLQLTLQMDEDYSKQSGRHPHMRHGHWKKDIQTLHETMTSMARQQMELAKGLTDLKRQSADTAYRVTNLETHLVTLSNRSEPLETQQRSTGRRVEALERMLDETDRRTAEIRSRVSNITASGIEKLHGSTLQLFEDLERLEGHYDRTVEELRREMSKLDYNLTQAQSELDKLKERHLVSEEGMVILKGQIDKINHQARKDRTKINLLQNVFLNTSFPGRESKSESMQRRKMDNLESKIASLSVAVQEEKSEMDTLHKELLKKADAQDLTRWERSQRKVREAILSLKENVPRIEKRQSSLQREMERISEQLPRDCASNSSLEPMSEKTSGVYLIQLSDSDRHLAPVRVYCDMTTTDGHWTVIQRRWKGDQDFNLNWNRYAEGFGDVESGDFWMGNRIISQITNEQDYTLRIDLWDAAGRYKHAEYQIFRVLGESDDFRLAVSGYSGNASDAMGYHNGMAFSTPDRDNDASIATHCGQFYGSGWWYNHCQYVNINGRYNTGVTWYDIDGQEWSELTRVEMKIRPRNFSV